MGTTGRVGTGSWMALALTLAAGCAFEEPVGEIVDDPPAGGRASHAISATNGISFNGLGGNGLALNGLSVNGLGGNGLAVNGIAINGVALNGLAVNGIGVNGIAANGIAANGLAVNGLYVNGIGVNGLYVNGLGTNGLYVNGIAVNGIAANGIAVNGIAVNGLYVNGIAVNGVAQNGLYVDGQPVTEVALHDLAINGAAAATAIKIGLAGGTIGNLTDGQRIELRDRVMPYLAYCALPASTTGRAAGSCAGDPGCVSIKDVDGGARYYWGAHGLAPEWKSGALSATGSDLVEGCLKAACAAGGASCQDGIALNGQQEAQLTALLKYAVSCALPAPAATPPTTRAACDADPGCVTIVNSAGVDTFYHGAIGLAPAWKSAPLDTVGQERVSACLGARTNASGEHVMLSLRGMGLSVTPVETSRFSRHEGGFYGNVFAPNPAIRTCEVEGGDMAGRICADGECGFTQDGDCTAACTTRNADGTYSGCAGNAQVLNTYLPFQTNVAAGQSGSCLIRVDGTAWCWGANGSGELGDGTTTSRYTVPGRVLIPTDSEVVQIVTAQKFAMARRADGTLWAWGGNTKGQLGDGTLTRRTTPVKVPLAPVVDVAVGGEPNVSGGHACAIKADGTLWCWGDNASGQLGNNTIVSSTSPIQVTAMGNDVVGVVALHDSVCALKGEGSVWCWGRNGSGELGQGNTTSLRVPTKVAALGTSAVQLGAGFYHACALKADASVWCWGESSYYATGQNSKTDQLTPAQVKTSTGGLLSGVSRLGIGVEDSCVSKPDGTMWCWGESEDGQRGDNSNYWTTAAPVTKFGNNVKFVGNGYDVTWAIHRDGTITGMGWNCYGELGNGLASPCVNSNPVRMTMTLAPNDGVCDFGESSITEAADCARPEVCIGDEDDDGDGRTDCADSDCADSLLCGGSGAPDTVAPTAPTSLVASAAGSTINLAWTAATDAVGVTGYEIERCAGAACTTFAQVGTSFGPSFASTALAANTTYRFRVRATDAAGNLSIYSTIASATTSAADTAAPSAPAALAATAASSSRINLTWTASTDAVGVTGYRIERCLGSSCTGFVEVGTSTTASYSSTGLAAKTTYRFRVRATDAAGNLSAYSGVAAATTPRK